MINTGHARQTGEASGGKTLNVINFQDKNASGGKHLM